MSRFILPLAALLLSGCSSFYSSSPEEKLAAYSTHRSAWRIEEKPKDFGLARSVQVIEGAKITIGRERLSYSGGLGMASLITRDGYALTAAHVTTNPPLDTFIVLQDTKGRPEPTVHVHRQSLSFNTAGQPFSSGRKIIQNKLIAYSPLLGKPTTVPVGETTIRSLRIVKSFPERDVALIKLPLNTAVCFELRRDPLTEETVLFSSGNWATPYRGTSAGKVTSINDAHPTATVIRTTTPQAKGDSGGPIFDTDGRLVGVASRVIPSQLLPYPKLRHSSLRTLDPDMVDELIAADRRQHR